MSSNPGTSIHPASVWAKTSKEIQLSRFTAVSPDSCAEPHRWSTSTHIPTPSVTVIVMRAGIPPSFSVFFQNACPFHTWPTIRIIGNATIGAAIMRNDHSADPSPLPNARPNGINSAGNKNTRRRDSFCVSPILITSVLQQINFIEVDCLPSAIQ